VKVFPIEAEIDFVYYLLQSHLFQRPLAGLGARSVQSGFNKADLSIIPLPIPPLPEQRAIARILGALDDKIELNRRMNATLEGIARALFQSWFVDFDPVRAKAAGRQPEGMDAATAALFPDAFEDSPLGPVPHGWQVSTIGEEVGIFGGSTPSTQDAGFWQDGSIHWATPKDLAAIDYPALLDTERRITEQGLNQISSGLLPQGTVLLSSRAPIGYLAIAEVPTATNQGFIAMVCDRTLPNHYILHWARANIDAIEGRANGTTFLEISKANFRPIPILVPPASILQEFDSTACHLHRMAISNLVQLHTLSAIRDTLLPKLLSGEMRVLH
jgi:type I restriction enzyme S subunit